MDRAAIERGHAELVSQHGSWTAFDIALGHGLSTLPGGAAPAVQQRVDRVVSTVRSFAGKPVSDLRVLDLACYEGGFGIALAREGAEVVGVDARPEHAARAQFAADALGLDRAGFRQADVRDLSAEEDGTFDVVLCLGILYHLDAPDCFELAQTVADLCTGLAIFETNVSLSRQRTEAWRGATYAGKSYPEVTTQPGAAIDNRESFWPTRPSLVNLLADVGFPTAAEILTPPVPDIDVLRDHVVIAASKQGVPSPLRLPERQAPAAHPTQGRRYRILDRVAQVRGRGVRSLFAR